MTAKSKKKVEIADPETTSQSATKPLLETRQRYDRDKPMDETSRERQLLLLCLWHKAYALDTTVLIPGLLRTGLLSHTQAQQVYSAEDDDEAAARLLCALRMQFHGAPRAQHNWLRFMTALEKSSEAAHSVITHVKSVRTEQNQHLPPEEMMFNTYYPLLLTHIQVDKLAQRLVVDGLLTTQELQALLRPGAIVRFSARLILALERNVYTKFHLIQLQECLDETQYVLVLPQSVASRMGTASKGKSSPKNTLRPAESKETIFTDTTAHKTQSRTGTVNRGQFHDPFAPHPADLKVRQRKKNSTTELAAVFVNVFYFLAYLIVAAVYQSSLAFDFRLWILLGAALLCSCTVLIGFTALHRSSFSGDKRMVLIIVATISVVVYYVTTAFAYIPLWPRYHTYHLVIPIIVTVFYTLYLPAFLLECLAIYYRYCHI